MTSTPPYRRTIIRVLAATSAALGALGATAVAAQAHPTSTTPFVITSISEPPSSTDAPSGGGTSVDITFNEPIGHVGYVNVYDDTHGWDASGGTGVTGDQMMIFPSDCSPTASICASGLNPGTTYTVTLGGPGKKAITSSTGSPLSGSDVSGVTVKNNTLTFSFTTAPAA